MGKVDDAIKFMDDNMIMLYGICSKEERKREIPDYIKSILTMHKKSVKEEGKHL